MLLALDTSTEMAGLALVNDGRLLAEITWYCAQNHTIQLLPQLSALLGKTGCDIKSVSAIAVAKGPGSFNGLRVGISTAKGLAFSLGIPLAGISTLEVEAYQFAVTGLPVCAIQNAGRSEIASATYKKVKGNCQQLVAEHITTIDKVLSGISTKTLFCGEYLTQIADKITGQLKTKAVMPPYASLPRRAFFLAELGQRRLDEGTIESPAVLQPLYLRRPPITERKHH